MGKVKQGKRLSSHRTSGDPMGSKLPLADEIESLKLAKSKSNDLLNTSGATAAGMLRKRQAEEEEVCQVYFSWFGFVKFYETFLFCYHI